MEQLIEILEEIKPGIDFAKETGLIRNKILESFDIISLISEIDEEMGVEIPVEEIVPENFDSVEMIMKLIEKVR